MTTSNNDKKALNVPPLRFPEFKGEWKKVLLKELVTSDYRSFAGGPFGSNLKTVDYKTSGVPIIQLSNITEGYLDFFSRLVFASEQKADDLKASNAFPGDLIIAKMMPAGRTCIATSLFGRYLLGSDAIRVKLDNTVCDTVFVRESINLPANRKYIDKRTAGSTRARIGIPELKALPLLMPSLNEQIRISMVMTAIDKNIDVQRKIIEECTKQMSSLFAFLNSGAKELHCFSEIGPLAKTDPLSWGDISYEGKNKCIIYGELFTKYHYQVSKAVSKTNAESKNTSEGNELLFPSSTTVDAVSLISPCALNEAGVIMGGDLFAVRVCSKFNALYLSFLFNCIYKNRLAKYAQGTTIIHLHYDDIKNFRFQSVSLDKQNKICKIMEDELKKIDVEQKELRTIENVKAYLLKNLFV